MQPLANTLFYIDWTPCLASKALARSSGARRDNMQDLPIESVLSLLKKG
jgi:hypothetical protein